ncbi:MAG: DUF2268 domain-containing protein [Saprospiraceae bacterium]|nr:DUF2268 domain-containing protein [Saprospiraceae bacterium]
MKKIVLTFTLLFGLVLILSGQDHFSNTPLDAKFITEDVERFWVAFHEMGKKDDNPFRAYLENASLGLKPFVPYLHPDTIYQTVVRRKNDYLISRNILHDLETKKKRIRAIYSAMKHWHPEAKFPPIYFAVGIFTSGGTVSENGLLIGTEMLENLDNIPGLVAHELIHFQQHFEGEKNLLHQSVLEGSADFIGELISGEHVNQVPLEYGNQNEDKLCREFVSKMNEEVYTDWLYGTSGKDDRPNDLGYWIGYKITEAYFNKQEDKHQAIQSILHIQNAYDFMAESGFLQAYVKAATEIPDSEKH